MAQTKLAFNQINSDTVNVVDYGTIGDGITDDYSAINTALIAAVAAKKPLYIPSDNYKMNTKLTVPEGAVILCEHMGKQTLDAFSDIGATFVFDSSLTGNLVDCSDRSWIDGLHVKGGDIAATVGMYGDRYNTWIDCTVSDCEESFEVQRWSNHLIRCNSKSAYIAGGNHIGFTLGIAGQAVSNDTIIEECISDAGDSTTAGGKNIVFYGGFASKIKGGNWGDADNFLDCPSSTGGGKLVVEDPYVEQTSNAFINIAHTALHVDLCGGWYNNGPGGASSGEYCVEISAGSVYLERLKVESTTTLDAVVNHTGGAVYWGPGMRHTMSETVRTTPSLSNNDNVKASEVIPFAFRWDISDGDLVIPLPFPYSGFSDKLMLKQLWIDNLVGPSGTTMTVEVGNTSDADAYMTVLSPSSASTGVVTDADAHFVSTSNNIGLGSSETAILTLTDNSETTGILLIVGEFIRFGTL